MAKKRAVRKRIRKEGKSKTTAVVLAVFFSYFTFLYTYNDDAAKFWICLAISTLLVWTIVVPLGVTIYAIVIAARRDDKWYEAY